ncbi:MAG: YfhO family protein [Bacteroidales bacterium]|nr:YfhO family protein [Bacteroidales bacterium]
MQKSDLKKLLPYIGSLLIFLILSIAYVSPVLEGKRLLQSDIVKFEGMAKEIKDFREETGKEALWTNSMFGGMPAFQISVRYSNNIAVYLHQIFTLGLPRPADMIFLYFAGFFIFLLVLKVNVWVAFLGALAFAFSSYHFIIIEAGHNSKALAIAYMAPVLAAIIHTFRGHYYSGGILFAVFLALQLYSNHLQITYYLLIIVVFYGIFELAEHFRQKKLPGFLKASGVLVAAAIIAIGVNIGNFWSTYSYTKHTMRGGTELTTDTRTNTSGLDPSYITQWSYGIEETLTLLIPNAKGGATSPLLYDELIAAQQGSPREQREAREVLDSYSPSFVNFIIEGLQSGNYINKYWGNQPFTSGPVYAGAVVMFLFILALFFVKGPMKWGFLAAIVLSILLAWGKNLMWFTEFFINYVPGYNKFRAVSMTLVIAELCIPALAFLGMYKWYENPDLIKVKSKPFYWALGLTGGLLVLLYLMPNVFLSFYTQPEKAVVQSIDDPAMLMHFQQVEQIRIGIFRADTLRSLVFILLAAGVIALFSLKKIKKGVFVGLIAILIVADMWPVNRRYFDDSSFVPKRQVENPYQMTRANMEILQDDELHFRVYNLTVSSFNDASTSWFHRSIGGYHGAKLQRYQELIDYHITQGNMEILNMLNTRYFIVPDQNRQPAASFNEDALGNAWFVKEIEWVANADEEIEALYDFDPAEKAIIDQRFEDKVDPTQLRFDGLGQIELVHYQPNKLRYTYSARADQLAVFSEVYYPDGWKVFINGEEADHFRVNYILRAMVLPAGQNNEVEFRFEPRSYYTGQKIAIVFSIIMVLTVLGFLYLKFRNGFKKKEVVADDQL